MRPLCLIPHLHNAWTSLCDTWHTTMPFCSEHICQLYIDQIYNTRWRHLAIKSTTQFFWLTKSSEATAFDCPHFKTTVLIYTKMCDMLCCKMHLRWQFHWLVPDAGKTLPRITAYQVSNMHIICCCWSRPWMASYLPLFWYTAAVKQLPVQTGSAQHLCWISHSSCWQSKIRVADFHQVPPIFCYKCSEQNIVFMYAKIMQIDSGILAK